MAAEFDESDFVDTEYQAERKAQAFAPAAPATASRPPSREELESKVHETQRRLEELKRVQSDLERERSLLEEARRRRTEYQTGREEMIQHLTRGVGLMEEAELSARRDAEQMARTLQDLRDELGKVQALDEEAWTQDQYAVELTRALTTLEHARMEWNSARLKWSILVEGAADRPAAQALARPGLNLAELTFLQLCRLGLALTWPLLLGIVGVVVLLLLRS